MQTTPAMTPSLADPSLVATTTTAATMSPTAMALGKRIEKGDGPNTATHQCRPK